MTATAMPSDWDDDLYLDINPDVRKAISRVSDGALLTGYDHYIRYGLVEGRPAAWRRKILVAPNTDACTIAKVASSSHLPDWAVEEMFAQCPFAPSLDPSQQVAFPTYDLFNKSDWGGALRELCQGLRHATYDYVFFLPWIRRGGADLASIFHIQSAALCTDKIAVVITEASGSEWLDRLPPSAEILHFGRTLGFLPLEFQTLACYHLIVALCPLKVHIINSQAAWKLLIDSSRAIDGLAELYVSLYCYDYRASGEPVGYAREIRRCAQSLTKVFTDNTTFRSHLVHDIGIPESKVVVLRHPVSEVLELEAPSLHSRRVLWASRLDRQKRPDLLIAIARRLPSLVFDVYGSAVLEQPDEILRAFEATPNVEYRGEFDRVSQVLSSEYRLFLYTSAWDGLPNIVLEAMRAGMLVVAGTVGGIEADIGPENCFIVSEADNPDAYVTAIKRVYAATDEAEAIRVRGQTFVRGRHTVERFIDDLRAAGYIEGLDSSGDAGMQPSAPPILLLVESSDGFAKPEESNLVLNGATQRTPEVKRRNASGAFHPKMEDVTSGTKQALVG